MWTKIDKSWTNSCLFYCATNPRGRQAREDWCGNLSTRLRIINSEMFMKSSSYIRKPSKEKNFAVFFCWGFDIEALNTLYFCRNCRAREEKTCRMFVNYEPLENYDANGARCFALFCNQFLQTELKTQRELWVREVVIHQTPRVTKSPAARRFHADFSSDTKPCEFCGQYVAAVRN